MPGNQFEERLKSKISLKETCSDCAKPLKDRRSPDHCACKGAPESECLEDLANPTESMSNSLPALETRFEILEKIGEGGMGSVFKVFDRDLDKIFAVKLLKNELAKDAAKQGRFLQELNSATELDHPNLVTVYSHGMSADGTPYMVMDFVDGFSMAEILAEDVFIEPGRATAMFLQICDGVAHAHLNGVVHLDLKPSNVLVSKRENVEIAKVSDFGIAQVLANENQKISQTEEIIGSLPYMSPEHCRGESIDYRSDIYSLGCLMYEVLTGKPPFTGENPVKTIMMHIQEKPRRLKWRLTRLDIPEGLERIVLHCLEKKPDSRYQNIEELIKDLELVRDGGEPHIALAQERLCTNDADGIWKKQKLLGGVAGLLCLFFFFSHLSQFDTFKQVYLTISSFWSVAILIGFSIVAAWLNRYLNDIAIRIKDKSQICPGDRWLVLALMTGCANVTFFVLVQIIAFLVQIEVPLPGSYHPHIFNQTESAVFAISAGITGALFAIWYVRSRPIPATDDSVSGW